MGKDHSMLELDGPSVSLFSFSALLERAVAMKGYRGLSWFSQWIEHQPVA